MRFNLIARTGLLAALMGVGGALPASATTLPSAAFAVGSANSNICMEASGFTSGQSVVLDSCNGKINQKFYIARAGYYQGQIAYTLENAKAASYQCVNDANKSTATGALVDLDTCNGIDSAERFVMNGQQLFNVASGECLDSTVLGQQLVLNPCNVAAPSQMWFQTTNNATP
jgi:Ricin-type beta-trefoil lectin domain